MNKILCFVLLLDNLDRALAELKLDAILFLVLIFKKYSFCPGNFSKGVNSSLKKQKNFHSWTLKTNLTLPKLNKALTPNQSAICERIRNL